MDMDEIEHITPDVIVLDYILGGEKSGWQMLQKLKMRRSTATIPVIVCTAATREVREIEGYLQAQGIALVPKPFDIDMLLDAIKRGLSATSATAEHARQRKDSEQAKGHE
jgi:DNA-binding response OmpR family regulator